MPTRIGVIEHQREAALGIFVQPGEEGRAVGEGGGVVGDSPGWAGEGLAEDGDFFAAIGGEEIFEERGVDAEG